MKKFAVSCSFFLGIMLCLGTLINGCRNLANNVEGDGLDESRTVVSNLLGYDRVAICRVNYGPEWSLGPVSGPARRHWECEQPIVFDSELNRNNIFIPDPHVGIDNHDSKEAKMRPGW